MPIYEPGLEELVRRNYRDGRLHFSTDMAEVVPGAEIVFIAVGTPPGEDGSADRSYVLSAARAIGEVMDGPLIVVVKSTVPVGTCDMVQRSIDKVLTRRGVAFKAEVVSNPEFLKEGKAISDFMRPDRIVVGVRSAWAREAMERLYTPFVQNGHPLLMMDVRSSEMTKYAANVMLATRISLMNEFARICDAVGADIMNVRKGIGTDARIGMRFLYAGVGYGGSCFPKDVKALAGLAIECGMPAEILEAVERVNRSQKMLLANRIISFFDGDVRGKHFAIWGLAFKPETDDIREAPALTIIKRLTDAGATVSAYDPEAIENVREVLKGNPNVAFASSPYEAAEGADALALVTEWGVFRSLDLRRVKALMRNPVLFDGRNQYDPAELREQGFVYHGIGRASL
jgi:UDPglucose 6-dehydrogenase